MNGAGLVLANGTNQLSIAAGATTFASGRCRFHEQLRVVTVVMPAGISCAVMGGAGTMPAAAVTSVAVTCSDLPYTLGGTISGLSRAGLVLGKGVDQLTVAAGASSFMMPAAVSFGSAYSVRVVTQPAA